MTVNKDITTGLYYVQDWHGAVVAAYRTPDLDEYLISYYNNTTGYTPYSPDALDNISPNELRVFFSSLTHLYRYAPGNIQEFLVNSGAVSICAECGGPHTGGTTYCDNCSYPEEELEERDSNLYEYNENVLDVLSGGFKHRNERSPLFMGVELEVEAREDRCDSLERVLESLGEVAICKEDGSLDDYRGFEIVTLPMSYKYHKEVLWKKFFKDAPNTYLKGWHGYQCGMHVHISRETISPLTLGKMLVFVHSEDNEDFIDLIAGRSKGTYCRRDYKKITDGAAVSSPHYDALSISEKTDGKTVELRIFRSNVSEDGFYKNLDFCAALVDFCSSASCVNISTKEFLKFMRLPSSRSEYKHLYQFLVARGKLEQPKNKKAGASKTYEG